MPTPTGTISLNDVNIELGRSSGANINMNDSAVRTLAGVGGSGTIITMNDLRGKSSLTVNYPAAATGAFYGSDYCGIADVQVDAPSISGGNGTYSYSWQRISASAGISINSTTIQRPIWSIYLCSDAASETWRVTVTSGSTSVTDDVEISLSYYPF
jgi:hypothetical protein